MIRLNIHEAKTHLSKYLARLEQGESIVLCRRNVPIAEIRLLPNRPLRPRPAGLERGRLEVPADINAALPDDLLDAFEGAAR